MQPVLGHHCPQLQKASFCHISYQGPIVQSIVGLRSSLLTNTLTVVTKVIPINSYFCCKNVSSFCMQWKSYSHFFFSKNINLFAIFQDRNLNITLANNFAKFWTTGPRYINVRMQYLTCTKYSYRQAWANSVDPDQMPQKCGIWLGSNCLPFGQQCLTTSTGSTLGLILLA